MVATPIQLLWFCRSLFARRTRLEAENLLLRQRLIVLRRHRPGHIWTAPQRNTVHEPAGNESVAVIYSASNDGAPWLLPLALMENPRAFASSVFRPLVA